MYGMAPDDRSCSACTGLSLRTSVGWPRSWNPVRQKKNRIIVADPDRPGPLVPAKLLGLETELPARDNELGAY